MTEDSKTGYIIEYVSVGKSLKVTAIDPETMEEVSIVGDPKATRKRLAKVAIQKLHYVQAKGKE